MAICLKSDKAVIAGGNVLATHIARDGATSGGVVTLAAVGTLYLKDWTLATGSRFLTTGSVYYLGSDGQIVPDTGSQALGQAISANELSIQIWAQQAATASTQLTTSETYTIIDGTSILSGTGSPSSYIGDIGDYYKDISKSLLYGPKSGHGTAYGSYVWGSPVGVRADAIFFTQYLVANLPTPESEYAFSMCAAIDGRKPGELAGAGTGVLAWCDGLVWYSIMDGLQVQA